MVGFAFENLAFPGHHAALLTVALHEAGDRRHAAACVLAGDQVEGVAAGRGICDAPVVTPMAARAFGLHAAAERGAHVPGAVTHADRVDVDGLVAEPDAP